MAKAKKSASSAPVPKRRQPKAPLQPGEHRRLHLTGAPRKIENDAEVREFVIRNITAMSFVELADLCREKFGPKRAPSKSGVHRFWARYADWLLTQQKGSQRTGT